MTDGTSGKLPDPTNRQPRDSRSLSATLRLNDGAGFLARVLNARVTALYEGLTDQTDVTPRQFGALLTLHQRGTLTLTGLAEAIEVDRSTLTEMVRRMAARGLIRRENNAEDRRSATVCLTPVGTAAVHHLAPRAAAVQDALLAPLAPEDRPAFLRGLKAVALAKGFGAVTPSSGDVGSCRGRPSPLASRQP